MSMPASDLLRPVGGAIVGKKDLMVSLYNLWGVYKRRIVKPSACATCAHRDGPEVQIAQEPRFCRC
eukprot:scaffold16278_cov107-Skeletonema_dohrnii-CCMP3373.AAC.3